MSDSKRDPLHGRHVANAQQSENKATQVVPVVPPSTSAPAPVPHAVDQTGRQQPVPYPSDSVFSTNAPMRPVDASQMGSPVRKRKRKPLKILGIVFGVLIALAALAYVGVSVYFTGHFMPKSTIGSVDVSLMSTADAEQALSESVADYKIAISGLDFKLNLTASDAGLSLDASKVVQEALGATNSWAWPLELRNEHDGTAKLITTYNETGLDSAIRTAVDTFNATATKPVDATIVYNEAKAAFVVEPEVAGTTIDADAVVKAADAAVVSFTPTVKLTSDMLVQPAVLSTDEKLVAAAKSANTMIKADLELTMAGTVAGEVDSALVSQWIRLGDDLSATLDEDALVAWVSQLAGKLNTIGSERTYTRPDGRVVTVAGGTYGWEIDNVALLTLVRDGVVAGQQGAIEVPYTVQGSGYGGVGSRDWGNRYVDVDLAEQHARFYDDAGTLVWESDIISGVPSGGEKDTPAGVWYVTTMASPSTLFTYEKGKEKPNETKVEYWMPFVGNTVGLHDAWWQPGFGGTMYKDGYGSHGCVNLPSGKAQELYGILRVGDVVVSHW